MDKQTQKIYEVIADKTLSRGCRLRADTLTIVNMVFPGTVHLMLGDPLELNDEIYERIIGHPVMIGDVLDWNLETQFNSGNIYNKEIADKILKLWREKRKPIEDQSEECKDFITSLIEECLKIKGHKTSSRN